MRNPVRIISPEIVAVTLPNTTGSAECFIDVDALPKFEGKRLRWLKTPHGSHVMTTTMVGPYELGIAAANVILDLPRPIVVDFHDDNPLNLTYENLELRKGMGGGAGVKPNRIYYRKDGAAYLALRNEAYTITLDRGDVQLIAPHQWGLKAGNKVYSVMESDGKMRVVHLQRFIMGLDNNDPRGVEFLNKDISDFRRSNLVITQNKRHRNGKRVKLCK